MVVMVVVVVGWKGGHGYSYRAWEETNLAEVSNCRAVPCIDHTRGNTLGTLALIYLNTWYTCGGSPEGVTLSRR